MKEASISSFNVVLFLSIIFMKSSWEKDDTIVESSFIMETVADVVLESYNYFLGDGFYFALSIVGK